MRLLLLLLPPAEQRLRVRSVSGATFPTCFGPIARMLRPLFYGVLLLLFLGPTLTRAHPNLELTIDGEISEQQQKNIASYLSLARLTDNEQLSEAMFRRMYRKAPKEAAKALEPFGYYSPTISLTQHLLEPGKWRVVLTAHPGTPVQVTEVKINLIGPGTDDSRLTKAIEGFPLRAGDILDHQKYEQGKDRLITSSLENGYQQATFRSSRVEIRKQEHSAAIQLDLETGPRYLIGPLHFQADFIDHDLLRKITPAREGDSFSPKILTRIRQSLFNAGYFSSVDVKYDLSQAEPGTNKVPITIVLGSNLTHKYGIGLGYGTDTGARGLLEYTNRHINRLGHQLDLQWQPSQRKSNFGGTYSIPIGDPKRDRLALTGTYATEDFENTETETFNTTVSVDHFRRWGEYSTYLQYLDESYDTGAELDNDQAQFLIPGLRGSIFWADDRLATKKGLRLTATAIGSEEGLLGDTNFAQTTLRAKGIYSFLDDWRIIGRSEIGTTLVDDIYDLPPSLRFYTGGDQSVRGYGYKQISPTDDEGNFLGGKNLLTYSLEFERTLYDAWSGAVFYDSGTVTDSFSNCTMHSGAGGGLRWNGVFGQVRLDLAKALDQDGSWRIHFTMGADL